MNDYWTVEIMILAFAIGAAIITLVCAAVCMAFDRTFELVHWDGDRSDTVVGYAIRVGSLAAAALVVPAVVAVLSAVVSRIVS